MLFYETVFPCILLLTVFLLYFAAAVSKPWKNIAVGSALAVVVVALSAVAYYLQPIEGYYTDFERIAGEVQVISDGGFSKIAAAYSALNPLSVYYVAIGSLFHDPNVLKALSALLMYGCFMAIPFLEWIHGKINRATLIVLECFILLIVQGPALITGIRQGPAFAIATLGIYLALIDKKTVCGFSLIILATLFHFSAGIVLAAALFSYIKSRKLQLIAYIIVATYTLWSYAIVLVLSKLHINALNLLMQKMNGYYIFGTNFELFAIMRIHLVQVVVVAMSMCVMLLVYMYPTREDSDKVLYKSAYMLILCFCIGSLLTSTPLRRFSNLSLYLIIPLLGPIIQQYFRRPQQELSIEPRSRESAISIQLVILFVFCVTLLVAMNNYVNYDNYYVSLQQVYTLKP